MTKSELRTFLIAGGCNHGGYGIESGPWITGHDPEEKPWYYLNFADDAEELTLIVDRDETELGRILLSECTEAWLYKTLGVDKETWESWGPSDYIWENC